MISAIRRSGGTNTTVLIVTGVLVLMAGTSSTFLVPVYGDDFRLAQEMYARFDGSLGAALVDSWRTGWQPSRFNPVGRWFALTYHFLAHDLGVRFGVSMHWFYRAGALLFTIALVLSAAYATRRALIFISATNATVQFGQIFAVIAVAYAATVQIHPWSHDPSLTISEIGLVSSTLAFVYLAVVLRVVSAAHVRWRGVAGLAVLSFCGIAFYETFAAAVAAAAVLFVWRLARDLLHHRSSLRTWAAATTALALPLATFLLGRLYVSSMELPPYAGTALVLAPAGLVPLSLLAIGMLPSSAWSESLRYAGHFELRWDALTAAAIVALGAGVTAMVLRRQMPRARVEGSRMGVVSAATTVLVALTLAMHAFTEKYISEITRSGQVYLSYAALIVVVACVLTIIVFSVRRSRVSLALVLFPLLGVATLAQQTVNWSVAAHASEDLRLNRVMTAMTVKWLPDEAERCTVLSDWVASKGWPEYYEDVVVRDANAGYVLAFGEPFCLDVASD